MSFSFWKSIAALAIALTATSACTSAAPNDTAKEKSPFDMVDVPSRFVLTGNASEGELALDMGASYVAVPAFGNPVDTTGRRLMDSDRPYADWNTTTGINGVDQSVTFDLQSSLALDEVALHFDAPQKPASVTVSTADNAAGPWLAGSTLAQEEAAQFKDNWWRLPLKNVKARFVKLDFKLKEWGWYLREVKIYGAPDTKIGAPRRKGESLVLADATGARAAIVVSDRTFLNTLEAAMLFQKLTRRMTGVLLPIVKESKYDLKTAAVFIGESKASRAHGVTIEQTPFGDDRYVMKTGNNWLALVGNDQRPNKEYARGMKSFRGSLYAVYDFFERQGFGWFGPQELWQIAPQKPSLVASRLNVSEIPVYKLRDLWMYPLDGQELRSAWRLGGTFVQFGHTYDVLVPPGKYKEAHPEWFGENQPDVTNPEVIRVAIETVIANFDARADEPFVTFPVGANDSGGWKEKPFNPAIGNNAAQQLYFTNEIAKGVRAVRPNRHFSLGMYGYWFSHDGPMPMLKGEPEVVIYIVNEGNHAKPLDMPEDPEFYKNAGRSNTRELSAIANWKKTGRLKGVYEWWIPVLANAA